MNRKINCIISLLLAITLSFSMVAPAFASDSFAEVDVAGVRINTEEMLPYIYDVAADAESWGYSAKDFDSLYIGLPIHTYEYLKTGTFRENDFVYYPIFSDDELLFLILEKEDGLIQVTQGFCDLLSSFANEHIAIIYDLNKTYIACADAEMTKIAYEFDESSEERGNLFDMSRVRTDDQIEWTSFSRYEEIPSLEHIAQPAYDPDYPAITLYVPKVLQIYDHICWAASTASIGNYLTGKNYTAVDVAQERYSTTDFDHSGTLGDSTKMLREMYNISYPYIVFIVPPGDDVIYTNLKADYPVFGLWSCSTGSHHITAIRGINPSANRISIMDPLQGYIYVQYSSSEGTYRYVSEKGHTFTCMGYASKL